MLKRLIEVALPLKEVSEQSAREKSIRHGHISTLHIWWARRPLAACRAIVFSSLIPDPDDPECPDSFPTLVNELLPQTPNGEDTPRNRCLEFIKHLVRWENTNNEELIGKARKLIAAAHKFLHPDADGDMPKVLDPFAGGGAIPLEALRLGCDAHAIDLNPVAHIIELCTLVYPQKFGQPNSRSTPGYIKKLEAAHEAKDGDGLFTKKIGKGDASDAAEIDGIPLTRLPLITEAEYQKNPLAADVKFWGHWVLERVRNEIGEFYPLDPDGSAPVAYLWARTAKCPNPACGAAIPLVRQLWLCKKEKRKVAMRLIPDSGSKRCRFEIVDGSQIDFDPSEGTMQRGNATCPCCEQVASVEYLRSECRASRMSQQMMSVVTTTSRGKGKHFRAATSKDEETFAKAERALATAKDKYGEEIVPQEKLPPVGTLGFRVNNYGMLRWGDLYSARQLLALTTFVRNVRDASTSMADAGEGDEHSEAVVTVLALLVSKLTDWLSVLVSWQPHVQCPGHVFTRQALPMVWDYTESVPVTGSSGSWSSLMRVLCAGWAPLATVQHPGNCRQGDAANVAMPDNSVQAVVTDPPYYDAVPYADLSDYFYVWIKRIIETVLPSAFRTPLTPKQQELVSHLQTDGHEKRMDSDEYESGMATAFGEMRRVTADGGICCVMFAHKTTSAWETIIAALTRSGLSVTSSWPLSTTAQSHFLHKPVCGAHRCRVLVAS